MGWEATRRLWLWSTVGEKDQSKGLVVGTRIKGRLGLDISGKGLTGPWG
jgi:hypothetical protein